MKTSGIRFQCRYCNKWISGEDLFDEFLEHVEACRRGLFALRNKAKPLKTTYPAESSFAARRFREIREENQRKRVELAKRSAL